MTYEERLVQLKLKQKEYWQNRTENTFLAGEKDALQVVKDLKANYEKCIKDIELQINSFYGKYAVDNKVSLQDAKKLLNRDELKSFKLALKEIQDFANTNSLDKNYKAKLKELRAKLRISRLNELQTNIEYELNKLHVEVEDKVKDILSTTYEDGYYKTIYNFDKLFNVSSTFAGVNSKMIEKALNTKYLATNYTESLYKSKTNLLTILNQEIPRGLTLGQNPRKLSHGIAKRLNTDYNNTVRLVRTEYNKILNEASAEACSELGIPKYKILATLDSRTSEICRDEDGKLYNYKDKEVGVNFPPFHPNCRTTTIPYFEPDEFEDKIDVYIKDEEGNKTLITDDVQYDEWKNALKKKYNGKLQYEGGE